MTVGELLQRMSSQEFTEWQAVYYKLDPFGDHRHDIRMGLAVAPLINLIRRVVYKDPQPVKPSDFIVDFTKEPEPPTPMAPEAMKNFLRTLAAGFQKEAAKQPKRRKR